MRLLQIDPFARTHHGLITVTAAADLGISSSSFYRAVAAGTLELVQPGVARVPGTPDTFHQRVLAGVLAAAHDAMASHRTATALWGVPRPDWDPIDILLPHRSHHSLPRQVEIHRPRDRLDLRPIMRSRIPCTNPMRTLLDLGAVDEAAVFDAFIAMLSSKVVSPSAVRAALVRHSRKGRHGVTALRGAFERWADDELPPDSMLEALVVEFLRTQRLPPVRFHVQLEGFEVDFQFVDTPVVLEADGWSTHGLLHDQFEFDRMRDQILVGAGYSVIHFTWHQLRGGSEQLADRIRKVLRWRAPDVLARATGA
jgi:very-short-patch-repair endonuclease